MTSGDKQFRILTPCNRDRDSLDGTGARRWCPDCRKTVYDFALMRRAEIDAVCASGSACGILAYQADGSLKTADPVTVPSMLRRRFLEWGAAMMVSARLAFAQQLLPVLPEGKGGIRGVIADPQGSPIPRARVYVGGTATYTDELGRFVLVPLEPVSAVKVSVESMGLSRGDALAAVRGGLYTDIGMIKLALGAVQVGDVIVIEPRPSASPSGSVEGHLAAIAPGDSTAELWVRLVPAVGSASGELRTRASGWGLFRFEHVASGDYDLVVEGLGWTTRREVVKVGSGPVHLGSIQMSRASKGGVTR